ncbi:DUF982 domain-containing protein [Mesorhizobium sp. BH1-1-5]|uniref:DUF982 domain-containing protein n=1 Tax=Mesorhizobium sp. BH1-1-5 TaxID=2876661 RepID=UPI001CCC706C|nr:DUF982 domain-containing protein [Mesorhizobium sp. BH1-1-5]
MKVRSFSHPVHVFVGLGFPCEISSVAEACQVLDDWSGARTSAHAVSSIVCRSALVGTADVEVARVAFEAFARAQGILAPDALESATNSEIVSALQ